MDYGFIELSSAFVNKLFSKVFSRTGNIQIDWQVVDIIVNKKDKATFHVNVSKINNASLNVSLTDNQVNSIPSSMSDLIEFNKLTILCDILCDINFEITAEIDDSYIPNGALIFPPETVDIRNKLNKSNYTFVIKSISSNFEEISGLENHIDLFNSSLIQTVRRFISSQLRFNRLSDEVSLIPEIILDPMDVVIIKNIISEIESLNVCVNKLQLMLIKYQSMDIIHEDNGGFLDGVTVYSIYETITHLVKNIIHDSESLVSYISKVQDSSLKQFITQSVINNLKKIIAEANSIQNSANNFYDKSNVTSYKEIDSLAQNYLEDEIDNLDNLLKMVQFINKFSEVIGDNLNVENT